MKIGEWLGKQRMRMNFAYGTVAIVGFGILILDVLIRWTNSTVYNLWYVVPAGFVGLWLVGYALEKYGIVQGEQRLFGDRNPYFVSIVERLERIEKLLDKEEST